MLYKNSSCRQVITHVELDHRVFEWFIYFYSKDLHSHSKGLHRDELDNTQCEHDIKAKRIAMRVLF